MSYKESFVGASCLKNCITDVLKEKKKIGNTLFYGAVVTRYYMYLL